MRWSDAHVGNIRQAPLEGQDVVNPEMKVPDTSPETLPEEPDPKSRRAEARAAVDEHRGEHGRQDVTSERQPNDPKAEAGSKR